MRALRSFVASVLVLAAGCGGEDPPSPTSWECSPNTDVQWTTIAPDQAPSWDPEIVRPRPADASFHVQFMFPSHVGFHSVYPVEAGADAPLRGLFVIGAADTTTSITVVLLVNGRVAPVRRGSELTTRTEVPIVEGRARVELSLPPESLDPGLNRVDVLNYVHRNGGYRLYVAPTFTVANGSLVEQSFVETEGLGTGTYNPGYQSIAYRTLAGEERQFPLWTGFGDVLENPTPMTLRLQAQSPHSRCLPAADHPDELMIVAFRDMEQVPLGDLERVVARVPPGEQRLYHFDMDMGFPEGEFHHLVILQLTGLTRSTRVAGAQTAPWMSRMILTEVFWGWQPTDG